MIILVMILFLGVIGVSVAIFFSLNSESTSQEKNLTKLKDELSRKTKELEEVRSSFAELSKGSAEKQNRVELLSEQVRELNRAKDILHQKEESLISFAKQNEELLNDLNIQKAQVAKLNTEITALNEVYSGLKEQYADLEKKMQKIVEEKISSAAIIKEHVKELVKNDEAKSFLKPNINNVS